MNAETLTILLTVGTALGLHLGVRWYIRHGLPGRGPDDWMA